MKIGIAAKVSCVAIAGMLLCSCAGESLGTLDVTVPKSDTTTVGDLFLGKDFDSLIVTCAQTDAGELRTLMGFHWDKASQAVPKDSGSQGLVLISGTQVVAAGLNDRKTVDFCSGTEFPVKLEKARSLSGDQSGDTWTVKWPKPTGK